MLDTCLMMMMMTTMLGIMIHNNDDDDDDGRKYNNDDADADEPHSVEATNFCFKQPVLPCKTSEAWTGLQSNRKTRRFRDVLEAMAPAREL